MSPEERKLLDETVELSRENNQMLRRMQSRLRLANFFSWLKWLIIIGTTIGAYYYLQPYLDQVLKMYSIVSEQFRNLPTLPR